MKQNGISKSSAPLPYDKEAGKELLHRPDLIGDVLHDVGKVVTGDGLKIANALLWGQVSLNAPDIHYINEGIDRVKRPQTHTFVLSPNGSVGIDTTYSVLEPLFTKSQDFNTLTRGALTSRENQTEELIDGAIVFLREFYANNPMLVNDVKSIMEERKLSAWRSYDNAKDSEYTKVRVAPSLFVGCNSISKLLDTAFYSRFDFLYMFNPTKATLLEIKDKQIETLPTKQRILEFLNNNEERVSKIAQYRDAFALLGDSCTDNWFVSYEHVTDNFNEQVTNVLNNDEIVRSRYPRDVEAGVRAMHLSTWLHQYDRDIENLDGSNRVIYANEDDLRVGVAQTKHTYDMKQQFLEILKEVDIEDRRTKQKEKEFYLENYDVLKTMPYRAQETWLRNSGYVVSHTTISGWDKEQQKLDRGASVVK